MGNGSMGNEDTGGNGVQGVWGTWTMRPTGTKAYRGYGAHGQLGTGVWVAGTMVGTYEGLLQLCECTWGGESIFRW